MPTKLPLSPADLEIIQRESRSSLEYMSALHVLESERFRLQPRVWNHVQLRPDVLIDFDGILSEGWSSTERRLLLLAASCLNSGEYTNIPIVRLMDYHCRSEQLLALETLAMRGGISRP